MPDSLNVTREGGVVRVALDRPDAGNAVDETVLDELITLLDEVRFDRSIRVLTLSGAGTDFCLGGDRAELLRLADEEEGGGTIRRVADKAGHVCRTLGSLPAVTVACVHGRCIGAGVILVLSCDLRIGTGDCSFRLPELALGMPTAWGGGLARVVAELGIARTRELVLLGNTVAADAAREYSILHRVEEDANAVEKAVQEWIRPLLRRPESALRATKDLLDAYAGSAAQGNVTALDSLILSSVVSSRARPDRRGQEPGQNRTPPSTDGHGYS